MKKSLIYHRPLSEYAHPIDLHNIVIRIKTGKDDLKLVKLFFGDTAYQGNPVLFTELIMDKVLSDQYFDYYEAIIKNGYERIVYYFELTDYYGQSIFYYADIFTNDLTIERNDLFKLPFVRKEDIYQVPKWFRNAIIYNIFLDSYTTDKNYQSKKIIINNKTIKNKNGGTIKNVINNLDNIKKMGFNTIYFNPIFLAGEYHKYDTIDYFKIDSLFGTNKEFKELVKLIHEKGMYIIIDGVFNHSGWYFKPFDDVIKNQEKSKYKNWFYRLDFPVYRPKLGGIPPYSTFGYERLMPKLNTSNQEVIDYFMRVCRYWMEEYKIDGWRLDVADEMNVDFLREFRRTAKKINPESIIIGEVWQNAQYFLDGSMFDSVMNYDFLKHLKAFFAKRTIDAYEFNSRIVNLLMRYRINYVYGQMNLLDSHDVPRFYSLVNQNLEIYKLAVIFLMTFVGVPSVFYGDEEGIVGVIENEYRSPNIYKNDEIRLFYQEIIKLKKEHDELINGKFKTIEVNKGSNLYHYSRYIAKNEIRIILNNSNNIYEIINVENDNILLQSKYHHNKLGSFGFIIYKNNLK